MHSYETQTISSKWDLTLRNTAYLWLLTKLQICDEVEFPKTSLGLDLLSWNIYPKHFVVNISSRWILMWEWRECQDKRQCNFRPRCSRCTNLFQFAFLKRKIWFNWFKVGSNEDKSWKSKKGWVGSLWEEIGVPVDNTRLSIVERWPTLFFTRGLGSSNIEKTQMRIESATSKVKGECFYHFASPWFDRSINNISPMIFTISPCSTSVRSHSPLNWQYFSELSDSSNNLRTFSITAFLAAALSKISRRYTSNTRNLL